MRTEIQNRLLEVNREFYASVAHHFDATRQGTTPGLRSIVAYLKAATKSRPVILDVGCGNGRLARILTENDLPSLYVGVDQDVSLLEHARESSQDLGSDIETTFVQADLADKDWRRALPRSRFDAVVCFATIQHLPGYALRLRLIQDLKQLSLGPVLLSFWQFLSTPRLARRQMDWALVGLSRHDVCRGDALLPWKQGVEAIRYVHQVDEEEIGRLAADAGLSITHSYRADGHEGNLNLYVVLE